MDGRGGAVQGAFINFFTMNPILPPEPIIDYSTEGVSKSKITSWAVIFSFLVSWDGCSNHRDIGHNRSIDDCRGWRTSGFLDWIDCN